MKKIRVLVYLNVEECDPDQQISVDALQDAAVDAVENAMRHAEDEGFSHAREDEVSIAFTDAVLYEEESTAEDDTAEDNTAEDGCEFCRHDRPEEPFTCPYCGKVWA
jgi:hypothetical protein